MSDHRYADIFPMVILKRYTDSKYVWISIHRGCCMDILKKPVLESAIPEVLAVLGVADRPINWEPGYSRHCPYMPSDEQTKKSFVYFIEGGGKIKIGVSDYPAARLSKIAPMSPVPLELIATIEGGFKKERELHTRFAKDRSHGEWFYKSPELMAYILSVLEAK